MYKNGLYFRAIPDSGIARVALDPTGVPAPIWPNHVSFSDNHKKYILYNSDTFWAGAKTQIDVRNIKWIINSLADVDEYKNSLIILDEFTSKSIPIFNHPRALLNTRRDIISEKISHLDFMRIPRCVRIDERDKENFKKAVQNSCIKPPLILRPEKSQTGQGMVVLDNDEEMNSYIKNIKLDNAYYITEFIDAVQEDNLYYKARIIIVGSEYFVRHVKVSKNRIVHRDSSGNNMSWEEEKKYIDFLASNKNLAKDLGEIRRSVGLDYFGVDFGVDFNNNKFIFFEANPAMLVFGRNRKNRDLLKIKRTEYLQAPIDKRLMDLLISPKEWMVNCQKFERKFVDQY